VLAHEHTEQGWVNALDDPHLVPETLDAAFLAELARPGGPGATADARCLSGWCHEPQDGVFHHGECGWSDERQGKLIAELQEDFGPGDELAGLFSHLRAIYGGNAVDAAARRASQREATLRVRMRRLLAEQLEADQAAYHDRKAVAEIDFALDTIVGLVEDEALEAAALLGCSSEPHHVAHTRARFARSASWWDRCFDDPDRDCLADYDSEEVKSDERRDFDASCDYRHDMAGPYDGW
jgi:hypothetical protein